jgi:hypothetical protein
VTDDGKKLYEATVRDYLQSRVSRSALLKTAAIGAVAAMIPGRTFAAGDPTTTSFPFYPQIAAGSYTPENVMEIVNVAATAEALAVTVLTAAVGNASTLGLTGLVLDVVQAALAEELIHLQVLRDVLGGAPITKTFYVPDPKILTDQATFLGTLEVAENLFIAAYMAACREFAELGQPLLAKVAYQTGAVEAEHRVLVRAALALAGNTADVPPNNKAFETDLVLYVADAAKLLGQLGFLGPTGTKAVYPGDAAALAAAGTMAGKVIQKTPNNATSTVVVTSAASLTGERA